MASLVIFEDFLVKRVTTTTNIFISVDNTNIHFSASTILLTDAPSGTSADLSIIYSGIGPNLQTKYLRSNTNIGSGNGIYITTVSNSLQFTCNNPDQVVTLIGGSYISIAGSYPSYTINSTSVSSNATNLGIPSYAVYAGTSNAILDFKSLNAGSYVSIVPSGTTLTISSTQIVTGGSNLGIASYAVFTSTSNGILDFKSLNAGSAISIVPSDTTLMINAQMLSLVAGSNILITGSFPTYIISTTMSSSFLVYTLNTNVSTYSLAENATSDLPNNTRVVVSNSGEWTTISGGQFTYLGTNPRAITIRANIAKAAGTGTQEFYMQGGDVPGNFYFMNGGLGNVGGNGDAVMAAGIVANGDVLNLRLSGTLSGSNIVVSGTVKIIG